MVEYLISANEECSDDWFDQVASQVGVKERTKDMKYLWIEAASEEIVEKLTSEFPYLKFDEVIS